MNRFITFEGGEGSGKSTQLQLLSKAFSAAGIPHVITREPGGSPGAEAIRKLLVSGEADAWDAESETLLFYAARLDHVNTLIKPALAAGKTVLCDRFADSTLVYQGVGKGLSEEYVRTLHHLTLGNFQPGLTIILDIDPVVGLKRAGLRNAPTLTLPLEGEGNRGVASVGGGDAYQETRFEKMDIDFHHRIRAGFLSIAKREPQRCVVVDAGQDRDVINAQILAVIESRGFI